MNLVDRQARSPDAPRSLVGSLPAVLLVALAIACGGGEAGDPGATPAGPPTATEGDSSEAETVSAGHPAQVIKARLGSTDPGEAAAFDRMKAAFEGANPGYRMRFEAAVASIEAQETARIVFVQTPVEEFPAQAEVQARSGTKPTELHVGDIAVLRPGESLTAEPAISALVFDVPDAPDDAVPAAIRPDWDPGITDVPGGCATETGAYRRILLTWLRENGPYTFHGLNAHRVRITDSFTHYHPPDTGFDEFYLVQMSNDEDRLLTSYHATTIESPGSVTPEVAADLFDVHDVEVGDLVYLPRGVVHRGLGGVLAQVITVPGFRPGTEIGVDHHLLAINERLRLTGEEALPFNLEASLGPVIR